MNTFSKPGSLRQPVAINLAGRTSTSACAECEARHNGMCEALSDEELSFFSRAAQRMTLPPGRMIMEEGEAALYFYNVNVGMVRLFKSLPDGRRQITGFASPGHFIGLASTSVNMISAESIDTVQFCRFSRSVLASMMNEYPALERKLLDIAIHELALNQQQLLLLGRKTALEKVVTFLLMWWRQQNACRSASLDENTKLTLPLDANTKLTLPLSRTDLADYLGLTIETVSRSLGSLKKNGLIDIPSVHEIMLLRPQALVDIAEASN